MEHGKLEDFKVGDVVQHKSNYQIEMVVYYLTEKQVSCRWVTEDHNIHEKDFYPQELVKFEKPY